MRNALLTIATTATLTACGDRPPADAHVAPASIQQLSANISNVVQSDSGMVSIHVRQAGYSESVAAFSLATEGMRIVEKARLYNLMPDAETVRLLAYAPFIDSYGNATLEPVLGFVFAVKDLNKINFSSGKFTEFELLNLYLDVWRRQDGRYSQNAIQAFCGKYRLNAARFCARESF